MSVIENLHLCVEASFAGLPCAVSIVQCPGFRREDNTPEPFAAEVSQFYANHIC